MLLLLLIACADPDAGRGPVDSGRGDSGGADGGAESADPAWCEDPAEQVVYEEVGAAWGLVDTATDAPSRWETNPVAVADLDGDGDDDVLLADEDLGLWLHRTGPDGFERAQVGDWAGLTTLGIADIDADGDLDVLAADRDGRVRLLRNDGDAGLDDATAAAGLDDTGIRDSIRDAAFADVDRDGDLDLFLTVGGMDGAEGALSRLFENDGAGAFTDISERLPRDSRQGLGWQGLWLDLEADGDDDLYLLNAEQSMAGPSRLLRNDGDGWTDITDDCACGETGSTMGGSRLDVDGDGLIDVFLANTGPSNLLWNQGDGSFVDLAASMDARAVPDASWMGFGSVAFDRDNDGDEDLFMTTGPLGPNTDSPGQVAEQADVLLERRDDRFVDVAADLGLDHVGAGRGVAVGLLDDDGALDIVVVHRGAASQVWRARCGDGRALVLDLQGPPGNPFGVGARVTVETDQGLLVREVRSRAGWGSAVHPRAHFGLGQARVLEAVVTWPDGRAQRLDLPDRPDRRMTVAYAPD